MFVTRKQGDGAWPTRVTARCCNVAGATRLRGASGVSNCASSRVRMNRHRRCNHRVAVLEFVLFARSVFERYHIVSECDLVEAAKKLNALQSAFRGYDGCRARQA